MKGLTKPIDVVAWFSKEGIPRQVICRIENKEQEESVVVVEKLLHMDRERLGGNHILIFRCQAR